MSTASTEPARISKLVVRDFRAFHGDETYTLPLNGKNLLLFGENGAGKSSLFQALRSLLSDKVPPKPFSAHRNVFTAAEEGTITVELSLDAGGDIRWEYEGNHPASDTADTSFFEFARRATFLDYKALLHATFLHEDKDHIDLFPLLAEVLLRDVQLPSGKTIAASWREIQHLRSVVPPPTDDAEEEPDAASSPEEQLNSAATAFRELLSDYLATNLTKRANEILDTLAPALTLELRVGDFRVRAVSTDPDNTPHSFDSECVKLVTTYAGHTVEHPAVFLNEARLTAIALALYLAGAQVSIPAGTSATTRLLVLDDVLIGLDLANRLPVLDVLTKEFADWQIILMTFDRVWFDLAKEYAKRALLWHALTLRELRDDPGQPGRPVVGDDADLLKRAKGHLDNGDAMAAAVYVRAAFESRLKNVCEKHGVKVQFKKLEKDQKADLFWTAIVDRQRERQANGDTDFIEPALMNEIEAVRSAVLNRLSHSGATSLTTAEVRKALDAVKRLHGDVFKKSTKT